MPPAALGRTRRRRAAPATDQGGFVAGAPRLCHAPAPPARPAAIRPSRSVPCRCLPPATRWTASIGSRSSIRRRASARSARALPGPLPALPARSRSTIGAARRPAGASCCGSTSRDASASGGAGWPGSRACRRTGPSSSALPARSTRWACGWPWTSSGSAATGRVVRVDRGVGPGRLRGCRGAGAVLECAAAGALTVRRRRCRGRLYLPVLIFLSPATRPRRVLTVRGLHHS